MGNFAHLRGYSSVRIKGIPQPLKPRGRRIDIADGEDVEPEWLHVPRRVTHEKVPGRENYFALFSPVYTVDDRSDAVAFASAHLRDDESGSVPADEVQLAKPAAIALFEDSESALLEIIAGDGLPGMAGCLSVHALQPDRARLSEVREFLGEIPILGAQSNGLSVAKLSQGQAAMHSAVRIQTQLAGHRGNGREASALVVQQRDQPVGIETHREQARPLRNTLRPIGCERRLQAGCGNIRREQPRRVRKQDTVQVPIAGSARGAIDCRGRIGRQIACVVEAQLRCEQSPVSRARGNEDDVDILSPSRLELQRNADIGGQPLIALIAACQVQ